MYSFMISKITLAYEKLILKLVHIQLENHESTILTHPTGKTWINYFKTAISQEQQWGLLC